jgi:DNA-binding response OmpR family regulator
MTGNKMKHQILLVDDQVSFCHHIKILLEQEGYEVAVADTPILPCKDFPNIPSTLF